jgi:peptidoglycan L-alanyl-D-glutamate endopeptidase CwlK
MTLEEALTGREIPDDIRSQLTLLDLDYWDFAGELQRGQLVIHRSLAPEVEALFAEITDARFPIARMVPVVAYDWSDDASMEANNCSAFNYRLAVGKSTLSQHSYGRAIDINPVQNPYIKGDLILPPNGIYAPEATGTLLPDGPVVAAFEKRGWTWGGRWNTLKDWHHFEKRDPEKREI